MLHKHFFFGRLHQDRCFDAIGSGPRAADARAATGRTNGMFGSHALLPRNLHSPEPPFSVELSPCTSGYSGGQSVVTWEELGEVLGDVRGWQGRMIVEGSRSRTIILRITQWIYPSFGDFYWTYNLFTTLRSHHIVAPVLDVRKRPCTRPNSAIVTAHWRFVLRSPRDPTPRAIRHLRRKCNRSSHSRKRIRHVVNHINALLWDPNTYSVIPGQHCAQSNSSRRRHSHKSRTYRAPVVYTRQRSSAPIIQYLQCIPDGSGRLLCPCRYGRPLLASQRAF